MLAVGNEVSGTTTLFGIDGLGVESRRTPPPSRSWASTTSTAASKPTGAEAGAAVLGGAVTALKDKNPNTLFAAGDNIGASTFTSFSQQDNPTIDALAQAGLDVAAVGNHEFDAGFADLTDRVIPRYGAAAGRPLRAGRQRLPQGHRNAGAEGVRHRRLTVCRSPSSAP